ncbi:YrbL family protein [Coraliomargarita parva]|uniref:YrbL family protein n=1 Tax=Coraliomargarita parva TaxID=3014050 RepID=UPI0022B48772|nr:YrbL family protein [Coraliomargarita parva]
MSEAPIQLSNTDYFSKGGNRLCYVSPETPNICLKVHQEHRTPELRRRRKSWWGRLKPLARYDENLQEYVSLGYLHSHLPHAARQHLPETYGLVSTDLGQAHATELIRDQDGKISQTIEQYIWENGMDSKIREALARFREAWLAGGAPTRDLLPHNLLLQLGQASNRIVLIDGYGRPEAWRPGPKFSPKHAAKRLKGLQRRIELVLERKASQEGPKGRLSNLNREL